MAALLLSQLHVQWHWLLRQSSSCLQLAEEQQMESGSEMELNMPGELTQGNFAFTLMLSGLVSDFHHLSAAGVTESAGEGRRA